ncbi:AraC family transcriptional regulator [Opitutus sp. ER46]|uniref:helix-turn-helix domain-containing protein n=1 Tax=Opitutus sp. ER46 TaxID=2161864 RepID=UPI001304AB3B|nr:AraC family transcriptional regulator [Opitutus sp. ER46]
MPLTEPDYFRYFAAGPDVRRWGVGLTGAGRTCVPARSPYPPARHPADHDFTWEHGRVLEALQLVYIVEGSGIFESQATGRCHLEAGNAVALLPGVWHRYRPDPDTGWTESWAEIQGPLVNTLRRAGVFAATRAVRVIQPESGFEEALAAVHLRARVAEGSFDPELAAVAFGLLAAWEKAGRVQPARSRMLKAISAAERYLADQLSAPVNVQNLARQLGVGYSHFRRAFRAHTGFAPWQYVLHLRLSRARRLLAASDATLDEIASRLGFSSGFHLSSAFKRAYGSSPEHWRAELAASRPRKGE